MATKVAYIWDYDIDEEKFKDILSGKLTIGKLDKEWATLHQASGKTISGKGILFHETVSSAG